jgi:hypothetical protein
VAGHEPALRLGRNAGRSARGRTRTRKDCAGAHGRRLVVEADITNAGSTARDVPRLRVALRDPTGKETQFRILDPPAARLAPGETAHFKTSFDHPTGESAK